MTTNGENQAPIPAAGSAGESKGGIIGATALAVIIMIALLDAVVETVWSGSPIRWWIAPPVVFFIAVVLWLWRPGGALLHRMGPASAAATLTGGMLALLTATAWLPGGQTEGVRMLGQPTPVVLAGAMATLVALATYVIIRGAGFLPAMPRLIVQLVFALLGIYALASFGLAIKDHLDFVALFQGGALWQRLPRWLQGSFVGALVLLPAAILAQVVRVFGGLRRKEPVGMLLHQATALVMCFVMALSGVVLPSASPGWATTVMTRSSGAQPPDVGPPTAAEFEQSGKALFGQKDAAAVGEEFVRVAEQELRRPGADPSDVGAQAAALGRDTGKIFEFVRDQVAFEPYTGVLRGARGTLAARAGNALDRALLAQAMLEAIGVESRLVAGKLSASQADTLLGRFFAASALQGLPAAGDRNAQASSLDAAARDVAAKAGASPDALAAVVRRAEERSDSFWWKADEQRATSLEFLAGQLSKGGGQAPVDGQAVLAMLRDRLKEHYWVQVKDPGGAWTEFDPSFVDARLGASVASDPAVLPKVPDDRFHRFELQLVYRTTSGGKPTPEILITRGVASADALFTPLELRIQPGEVTVDAGALRTMDARQRADLIRKFKRFHVLLRAGTNVAGGRGFDLEGHTFDASAGPSSGSAAGMMGGMLGFGGESEPAEFVDLQIVLRLSGPGREPMTQTRTLIRAADTKSPTFAPPIGEWQMLVQPQWISPDLAGFQMLSHLTGLARAMTSSLKARDGLGGVALPAPIPQQLLQFALLRQNATARILAGQAGLRAFIDSPMVTVAGHRLSALRPDEGMIVAERTIDIVENAARFVTKDSRSQAPFQAALGQGVADCTLEQRLLQEAFPEAAATSGTTVFERAKLEGRQPLLTRAQDADALRAAGLAETDVEWIGANESPQARLVVAKAAQGPAAWWSVRPDGTAVLRVSGGQGQGLTEHQTLVVLKVLAFLICGVEIYGATHHWKEAVAKMSTVWCIAATVTSGGMFLLHAHMASWIMLAAEALVLVGTQAYETYGHE